MMRQRETIARRGTRMTCLAMRHMRHIWEVHVRRPFCLFGQVTPHVPIRDALDRHMSHAQVDLAR